MNYYNENTKLEISDSEIQEMGISLNNTKVLQILKLFKIENLIPKEIDQIFYTIKEESLYKEHDKYIREYVPVYLPVEIIRDNLKYALSGIRYQREMGGVTWVNNENIHIRLNTNIDARIRLQTAIDNSKNVDFIEYKLNNVFKRMTHIDLIGMQNIISSHVQSCFDFEKQLFDKIDAATTAEELQQIKWDEGWPGE